MKTNSATDSIAPDLLEERKEKPLLQLLDDFGGWPILSADWNATHVDHWVDVMARLRLYNNDIFISLWVGPDGKDSDSHIIQVGTDSFLERCAV